MNIPQNFDRWMFDYMEGNLSPSEADAFEQFLLQNPGFEPDADAWNNSIIPIDNVVYPNQSSLERNNRFAGWFGWSAAAALILLIGVGGFYAMNLNNEKIEDSPELTLEGNYSESSDGFNAQLEPAYARQNVAVNSLDTDVQNNSESEEYTTTAPNQQQYVVTSIQNGGYNAVNNGNGGEGMLSNQNRNDNSELNHWAMNDFNDADYYVTEKAALEQEKAKYGSNDHASKYANNPTVSFSEIDLRRKNNLNQTPFRSALKRVYRKIERKFGYPVGLVNLRDPELLLPENSLLASNPGFAGGMLMSRLEMSYKNQWLGTDMNVHRSQLSYDNYIKQVRGGFGISVNSAVYGNGAFADYSVDLTYSPKISLGQNAVLEPGIKVSLGALTANSEKMSEAGSIEVDRGLVLENSFASMNDQTDKLWYKDYGVGVVLNTTWFYAGLNADNLNRHYANVYREEGNVEPIRTPVLFSGVIGADYESSNKTMSASPFIAARYFGTTKEAWAGVNFKLNHFTIGGSYSTNKDFTATIGMKFNSFKMVYQYDRTTTLLTNEQFGSHNIGMRFNWKSKKSRF